jgi:hypothetical protein
MSINIADHLTKILLRILFHQHADYLLGHVPPKYSPVYQKAISTYGDSFQDIVQYVPETFTTPSTARWPLTATVARIFVPLHNKIKGNPWLIVLWHSDTIHTYIMDCGGVKYIRRVKVLRPHFYSYPLMPSMTGTGVLHSATLMYEVIVYVIRFFPALKNMLSGVRRANANNTRLDVWNPVETYTFDITLCS